jgi:hypothetical protein
MREIQWRRRKRNPNGLPHKRPTTWRPPSEELRLALAQTAADYGIKEAEVINTALLRLPPLEKRYKQNGGKYTEFQPISKPAPAT